MAEDIRIEKEDAARTAKLYGEENRITIPHVFRHENGLATTDRATEIFMKVCMSLYFPLGPFNRLSNAVLNTLQRPDVHFFKKKTREQPKNPPRASISLAKDLIYSSAPPPVHQW